MDSDRGKARRPAADAEMVAFVQRIGRHARETRGVRDFAVVPQNGEPLLKFPEYRAAISAIGKEDILYRMDGQANKSPRVKQNSDQDIEVIMQHVRLALADRIPVLAVEYLRDRDEDKKFVALSRQRMREMGLVPHFGKRLLADLSPVEAAPDMAVS